jgi:hypothetical protein
MEINNRTKKNIKSDNITSSVPASCSHYLIGDAFIEIGKLKNELEMRDHQIKLQQDLCDSQFEELQNMRAEKRRLCFEENQELKQELDSRKIENHMLEEQVKRIKLVNHELESELESMKTHENVLKTEISLLQREKEVLEKKAKEQEAKMKTLHFPLFSTNDVFIEENAPALIYRQKQEQLIKQVRSDPFFIRKMMLYTISLRLDRDSIEKKYEKQTGSVLNYASHSKMLDDKTFNFSLKPSV